MYILLEYNKNYKENIKELKKYKLTPVVLFRLTLNNKNQIKTDLQKIKEIKSKINPKNSAVIITIEKLENSTIGTVNNLKLDFDIVIGLGGLNKINRFFLESTRVDFLQDPQNTYFKQKMDFIHHFNSGLNQVLCEYAKQKQIGYIFSLNFTTKNKRFVPKEIGRINQNLRFARKYKTPSIINFVIQNPSQIKTQIELIGIMSLFDLSTQQKQQSLKILEEKVKQNKFKKTDKHIAQGIEII